MDAGEIWSGISGVLTFSCPSTYVVNTRSYNDFIAQAVDGLVFYEGNASGSNKSTLSPGAFAKMKNVFIDQSFNTSGNPQLVTVTSGCCVFENLHQKMSRWASSAVLIGHYSYLCLINPSIEITGSNSLYQFFAIGNYGSRLEIIGGRLFGDGATSGVILLSLSDASGGASFVGFEYPVTMTDTTLKYPYNNAYSCARIEAVGIDGGAGALIAEGWGVADSRSDGNYPTLDAFLPDTDGTPWSWRIYPRDTTKIRACRLPFGMFYTESASTKTITVELQHSSTISVDRSSVWVDVHYIDNTSGLPAYVTSKLSDSTALDSSSADWSAGTYGPITLVKRKISIATPTAIKQNTMVHTVFRTTFKSASANDIFFVCPDVGVS